jgi:hypothetical protein
VTVQSASVGSITATAAFTYSGVISVIAPDNGAIAGNYLVTITGSDLGNGSDITSVSFHNQSATIQMQTSTRVVVTAPASTTLGLVNVTVSSQSGGYIRAMSSFTYYDPGTRLFQFLFSLFDLLLSVAPISISQVTPAFGVTAGGYRVTISGANLGGSTLITAVYMLHSSAPILSQSNTQVVVWAPPGSGSGPVILTSSATGNATRHSSFTYTNGTVLWLLTLVVELTSTLVCGVSGNCSLSWMGGGAGGLFFTDEAFVVGSNLSSTYPVQQVFLTAHSASLVRCVKAQYISGTPSRCGAASVTMIMAAGEYITSVAVTPGNPFNPSQPIYVGGVRVTTNLGNTGTVGLHGASAVVLNAPANGRIVGFIGRGNDWLDALGVITQP